MLKPIGAKTGVRRVFGKGRNKDRPIERKIQYFAVNLIMSRKFGSEGLFPHPPPPAHHRRASDMPH